MTKDPLQTTDELGIGNSEFAIPPSRAFTLVEMLVVIGLVGLLAATLAVVVTHVRRFSVRVECQEHLRQIGQTIQQMALAKNGAYPPLVSANGIPWWAAVYNQWPGASPIDLDATVNGLQIPDQLPGQMAIFHCRPAGALDGSSATALNDSISYGMVFDTKLADATPYRCVAKSDSAYPDLANPPSSAADRDADLISAGQIANPSEFILLSEAYTDSSDSTRWTGGRISMSAIGRGSGDTPPENAPIPARHEGMANVLFADLHIEAMQADPALPFPEDVNKNTPLWTLPDD